MKRMIAIALFVVAGFIATGNATAETSQQGHLQTIQYSVPPVPVMTVCEVNGVDYQVDYNYRIWAVNGYGRWFVIGRITTTPTGAIAIRNDGARYPAACE
jgi:hypothetical protein